MYLITTIFTLLSYFLTLILHYQLQSTKEIVFMIVYHLLHLVVAIFDLKVEPVRPLFSQHI